MGIRVRRDTEEEEEEEEEDGESELIKLVFLYCCESVLIFLRGAFIPAPTNIFSPFFSFGAIRQYL